RLIGHLRLLGIQRYVSHYLPLRRVGPRRNELVAQPEIDGHARPELPCVGDVIRLTRGVKPGDSEPRRVGPGVEIPEQVVSERVASGNVVGEPRRASGELIAILVVAVEA